MTTLSALYMSQHKAAIDLLEHNPAFASKLFDEMCGEFNINADEADAGERLQETVEKKANCISTAHVVTNAISKTLTKTLGATTVAAMGEQERIAEVLEEGNRQLAAVREQLARIEKGCKELRASSEEFGNRLPPPQSSTSKLASSTIITITKKP
jgi:hypothetical protein